MDTLLQDIRYGLRVLRKDPVFAAAALLTIALGIGANTAIFSIVNAVLIRPLPYPAADRLVYVNEAFPEAGFPVMPFSAPDFKIFADGLTGCDAVAAFQNGRYDLSGGGAPERVTGARVSPAIFELLGARAARGRTFRPDENVPGSGVVVISHGLWQRRFGGDPGIVGRTVRLDRQAVEVVGVMPPEFRFPLPGLPSNNEPAELWVPVAFTPFELEAQGSMYNNSVIARLKAGVTLAQGRAEAEALARRIEDGYAPALKTALGGARLQIAVTPLQEAMVGDVRTPLLVLLGAVGLVLLIGCANVANLLLARAAARRKEMAIRGALGARPARLLRQVLTEGLVLALLGGALGTLLAAWAIDALLALVPVNLPHAGAIGLDGTVLAYTLLASLATAVLFGLAPGLAVAHTRLRESLQESGRGGGISRGRRRLQAAFVVVQFALALVLLVGAGLLLRSFIGLMNTDPGFHNGGALTFSVTLPSGTYARADQLRAFYSQAVERLGALPGVRRAAAGTAVPLGAHEIRALQVEGLTAGSGDAPPSVAHVWVQGDYLGALGIPLKRGRAFTAADRQGQLPVALVSETMARLFWPGQDAIGRRFRWYSGAPWMTVVGVVGDVKDTAMDKPSLPRSYSPYEQEADEALEVPVGDMYRALLFVVDTERDPAALMGEIRAAFAGVDRELALANVGFMDDRVDEAVAPQRFAMSLLALFAGLALVLAGVGIYGVMAYSVTQRTQEIGVRMALGARQSRILRQILGEAGLLVAVGAGLGLVGALAAGRVLASLLYGVGSTDPVTFAGVLALLAAVALLAGSIPAWRASRVAPLEALRYE